MEKRLVLAIALSFLILFSFNYFTTKLNPPPEKREETLPPQIAGEPVKPALSSVLEGAPAFLPETDAGEVKVETSLFKATINRYGAGLKSWRLKRYKDKEEALINLVRPERRVVNLPLNIYLVDEPTLVFKEGKDFKLSPEQTQGELLLQAETFSWQVTKKLSFDDQQYLLWLDLSWKNLSSERKRLPDYYLVCTPGFGPDDRENRQYAEVRAGLFVRDRLKNTRWKIGSLVKRLTKRNKDTGKITHLDQEEIGLVQWIAYRVKYFAVIIKPENPGQGIRFSGLGQDEILCQLKMSAKEFAPGEMLNQRFAVYLGPVDYDELKRLNLGLESIFDSGGLAPLRRLVMTVLKFFYKLVGNWGVAIILLTIVAKIILLPLTQKSFRSMKEMQKLQPQINSLRQVYKDNPQKIQKEIMELYRRHKVNPMGGCFPMLLQMPVFIALFTALRSAIELRQAPFIFWIHDLSTKDPYYVLPILMGGTMFLQQKMTPAADPQQARMAMIMPVVFTFLFMNFPSGLVLYWLVNSVLSLGEQWWIRKEK